MRFAIVKIVANQMSETTPTQHICNFNMAATNEGSFFFQVSLFCLAFFDVNVNFVRNIVANLNENRHKNRPVEIRLVL